MFTSTCMCVCVCVPCEWVYALFTLHFYSSSLLVTELQQNGMQFSTMQYLIIWDEIVHLTAITAITSILFCLLRIWCCFSCTRSLNHTVRYKRLHTQTKNLFPIKIMLISHRFPFIDAPIMFVVAIINIIIAVVYSLMLQLKIGYIKCGRK